LFFSKSAYSVLITRRPFGYRYLPGRWILVNAVVLASIASPETSRVLAQSAVRSFAQSFSQWAPLATSPGEDINLFVDWDGTHPVDGFLIETAAWDVVAVEAVRLGRNDRVIFSIRRWVGGVVAEASERLVGRHRLIITLRSPDEPSSSTVLVVPSIRVEDSSGYHLVPDNRHELEFDVDVAVAPLSGRALRLSESRSRWVIVDPAKMPDLSSASGFTVAFWLKSIDREKVVLSSWTGSEFEDYSFEFVIDAGGEMRVYSGQGGMHYSVGSGRPIADGSWHHFAYSVNYTSGLAIMTLDGAEVDSRFLPDMGRIEISGLSIGGRYGREWDGEENSLNGLVDEFVFLPAATSAAEIGRMSRVPVAALESPAGAVLFDFEPLETRVHRVGIAPDADYAPSNLILHQPATDIVAEFHPGSVSLAWTVVRPEPQVITVERSDDGVLFETMYRTAIHEAEANRDDTRQFFSFEDFISEGSPIYFYRIRQEFTDQSVIRSQMIKIGVGSLETPTAVELIGNSPNPFATSTEVNFRVFEPTQLRLSVWSVSGHLIKVLASETRDAGFHRILFEAGDLPSGIYFLRLETGGSVQTRKMIVRR